MFYVHKGVIMKKHALLFLSLSLAMTGYMQAQDIEKSLPEENPIKPVELVENEKLPTIQPEFSIEEEADDKTLDDLLEEIADSSVQNKKNEQEYYDQFTKQLALGYQLLEKGTHIIIPATASAVAYFAYNKIASPCFKLLHSKYLKKKVAESSAELTASDDKA